MNENQPTPKYVPIRKSNLLHDYYAVNSIDGRKKISLKGKKQNYFIMNMVTIINKIPFWLSATYKEVINFKIPKFSVVIPQKIDFLLSETVIPAYIEVTPQLIPLKKISPSTKGRNFISHYRSLKSK